MIVDFLKNLIGLSNNIYVAGYIEVKKTKNYYRVLRILLELKSGS